MSLGDMSEKEKDIVDSDLVDDQIETITSTNIDFMCFQNVKGRLSALVLLLKLVFDKDKEFQHFVIDGGSWDRMKVFPENFLSKGKDKNISIYIGPNLYILSFTS